MHVLMATLLEIGLDEVYVSHNKSSKTLNIINSALKFKDFSILQDNKLCLTSFFSLLLPLLHILHLFYGSSQM